MLKTSILAAITLLALASPAMAQQNPQPSSSEQISQMAAERMAYDAMPNLPGTGPYPAIMEVDPTLPGHVVYRPGDLTGMGRTKLPILVWGNGGCTDDAASARLHLLEIASHGYLVIAPGRILSGPGKPKDAPAPQFMSTSEADMLRGLDWAIGEARRKGSPYFRRVDVNAVAFSGHSCGGILSIQISNDPRVRTIIIHNSGVFPNTPQRPMLVTDKAWLQDRLHTPILYVIGNDSDVGHPVAMDDFSRITKVPVFLGQLDVGHQGTFQQPNGGEAARVAVSWLEWQLRGDRRAGALFTGMHCGLCGNPAWQVRRKKL